MLGTLWRVGRDPHQTPGALSASSSATMHRRMATPTGCSRRALDETARQLNAAADYSRISHSLASVTVTSATVNLTIKPLARCTLARCIRFELPIS